MSILLLRWSEPCVFSMVQFSFFVLLGVCNLNPSQLTDRCDVIMFLVSPLSINATVLVLILAGPRILSALGIPLVFLRLFDIDLVAVGMQMVLMGVLNAIFYFDYRGTALLLNLLFVALNVTLTLGTQLLGYTFYGYGYALACTLTTFAGLLVLMWRLDRLEYETFMLQK